MLHVVWLKRKNDCNLPILDFLCLIAQTAFRAPTELNCIGRITLNLNVISEKGLAVAKRSRYR